MRWHIRSWITQAAALIDPREMVEVAYPELEKRLEDIKGRGVVLRDGQTLYDLYLERTPLYEKYADIRISETGLDIEQTVEQIVDGITNLH
mgnify:CR=1 FL=1